MVLDSDGRCLGEITVPGAPELSGVCLSNDQTTLFITEASTGSVYYTQAWT